MSHTLVTTPYRQIESRSGKPYAADANGIVDVSDSDLSDLLNSGCKFPAPRELQICTNRNAIPNGKQQGTLNSRTDVRFETRYLHQVGAAPVSDLTSVMTSTLFTAAGETGIGNSFNWESVFEQISPSLYHELSTLGAKVATIADFLPYLQNDNVSGIKIPGNGTFWHRQGISVTSDALYMPTATPNIATGDTAWLSPATVSQIPGTGILINPTSPSAGTGSGNGAAIILGRPLFAQPAVTFLGDSIADGSNDTSSDATGANGFLARGFANVNGSCMPSLKQTVSSQTLYYISNGSPSLRSMWRWTSHLALQAVTNDVAGGRTLQQLQGYVTEILTAAKETTSVVNGKPLKTCVVLCPPRTSSTDSWATAANQSPYSAGFAVGSVRDQYNNWIKSIAGGGLLDAYIDPNQYWEDPANPGKWVTNGSANTYTIDGVHPNTNLHILAAQAVNSWAQSIRA